MRPGSQSPTPDRRVDPSGIRLEDVFVLHQGAGAPVMALRGIDLQVGAGERLLVEGPNGSGKSTLLRTLTGEQQVSAGRVVVGGVDITDLPIRRRERWRARTVGYVDQHARRALLPELDVLGNVALHLRLTGRSAATAHTSALETLTSVGLAGLRERSIPSLSGGEAQRVAICAAVAHRPALLLADEPTGELDEDAAHAVIDLISSIAARGSAVLLVTHDPRARRFTTRRVVIRDGRIAQDAHDTLDHPGPGADAEWGAPAGNALAHPVDSRGWRHIPPAAVAIDVPAAAGALDADQPAEPLVQLAGVATTFPGREALPAIDLVIGAGEWIALSGPSGSGKTTLLHQICGLADPTSGTVTVGGTSWSPLDRGARAEHRRTSCALATQRTLLVESLTAAENLEQECAIREITTTGIGQLLADTALSPVADREAALLSGGERQRLALARALISGAPVLVLDEPTSQQDEVSARKLAALLRTAANEGRCVISSSHDPLLLATADRVLDISLGSIGTADR